MHTQLVGDNVCDGLCISRWSWTATVDLVSDSCKLVSHTVCNVRSKTTGNIYLIFSTSLSWQQSATAMGKIMKKITPFCSCNDAFNNTVNNINLIKHTCNIFNQQSFTCTTFTFNITSDWKNVNLFTRKATEFPMRKVTVSNNVWLHNSLQLKRLLNAVQSRSIRMVN